jgi:hypothetical protein
MDKFGNIIVAATCESDENGLDMVVIKCNSSLVFQWSRSYDGPVHGDDKVAGLVVDSRGNVFVCGTSPGTDGKDIAVKGLSSGGSDLWTGGSFHDGAKRYDAEASGSNECATDMAMDLSRNLVICGHQDVGADKDGLLIVIQSDGDIKSGWPRTYNTSSGANDYFYGVAVDSNYNVSACGKVIELGVGYSDILVVNYTGGGTLTQDWKTDGGYNQNDTAKDIAVSDTGVMFITGSIEQNGGPRMIIQAYDVNSRTPAWTRLHSGGSWGNAIAWSSGRVYATGGASGGNVDVLTYRLAAIDGTNNWGTPTYRIFDGEQGEDEGLAIFVSGSNVYVTGYGKYPFEGTTSVPQYHSYLTLGYNKVGDMIPPFEDFYPIDNISRYEEAYAVVAGRGRVCVTGKHVPLAGWDATTLMYAAPSTPYPPSSHTVEVGTGTSGNTSSLEDSDNVYLVVQRDAFASNPMVAVRVEGNVGSGVSELTFIVESKVSTTGIAQRVQLYNYDTAEYETVDERPIGTTDVTLYLTVPGDPDPYIDGSGNVKARILYDLVALPGSNNWSASIDVASWSVLN